MRSRLTCVLSVLACALALPARAQVTVSLDATSDVKPIDPLIYGVNFAGEDAAHFDELKYPANRWGGNSVTRYNWQLGSHNTGSDWAFLSIANGSGCHDQEFDASVARGSDQLVTVPMIGWVSNVSGSTKVCSYPEDIFPVQDQFLDTDSRGQRCGNGQHNGVAIPITDAQKARANVAVDATFVSDWVTDIRAKWPSIHHYALDNEPCLWQSTHADVRSNSAGTAILGLTATELWTRTVAYATAIKAVDPQAKIHGPTFWGWCAYFGGNASTADLQGCSLSTDAVAWYLDQVKAYQTAHGTLLVDYLDLHYYPQGQNGVGNSSEYTCGENQAVLRLQSIRELYDRGYSSQSWIGTQVYLIPRMKDWIAAHAAGLGIKTAISEYNWGDTDGISAALAQAEILSIFARQGLDAGYRWVHPGSSQAMILDAFRMYLSFDGAGSRIVGNSISSSSSAVDTASGYGVVNAGKLYVSLFNKSTSAQTVTVNFANATLSGAAGDLYGFTANVRYAKVGTLTPNNGTQFAVAMPARSARLAVLPLQASAQCNNNGTCDSGETFVSCPADCPAPVCNNNGVCDTGETTANCPADCPASPCNHNGTCEAGETNANCPADCPCNNNGTCDSGETTASCPADCPSGTAWTLTATASPNPVAVGASVTLTAHVRNAGATVAGGNIQIMRRGNSLTDLTLKNCSGVTLTGAGATTDCVATWMAAPAGTYRVAIQAFDGTWTTNFAWTDNATTFTVGGAVPDAGATPGPDGSVSAHDSGTAALVDSGTTVAGDSGTAVVNDAGPAANADAHAIALDGGLLPDVSAQSCGCASSGSSGVPLCFALSLLCLAWRGRRRNR